MLTPQEQTTKVHNLCIFLDTVGREDLSFPLNAIAQECSITIARAKIPTLIIDAKLFDVLVSRKNKFSSLYLNNLNTEPCKLLDDISYLKKKFTSLINSSSNPDNLKNDIVHIHKKIVDQINTLRGRKYHEDFLCYLALEKFEKKNIIFSISTLIDKNISIQNGYLIIPTELIQKRNLQHSNAEQILKAFMFNTKNKKLSITLTNLEKIEKKVLHQTTFSPSPKTIYPKLLDKILVKGDEKNVRHIYWTGHGSNKHIGGTSYDNALLLAKILEQKNTAFVLINSCYFGSKLAHEMIDYLELNQPKSGEKNAPMLISSLVVADICTNDYYTSTYQTNFPDKLDSFTRSNNTSLANQILSPIFPYIYFPQIEIMFATLENFVLQNEPIDKSCDHNHRYNSLQSIANFKPIFKSLLQRNAIDDAKVMTNIPQIFFRDIDTNQSIVPIDSGITILSLPDLESGNIQLVSNNTLNIDNKNLIVINFNHIALPVRIKNIPLTRRNKPNCIIVFNKIDQPYYRINKITSQTLRIKEFIFEILFNDILIDYLNPITVVIDSLVLKKNSSTKQKHYKNVIVKHHSFRNTKFLAEQILSRHHTLPIQGSSGKAITTYRKGKSRIAKIAQSIRNIVSKYDSKIDTALISSLNKENQYSPNFQGQDRQD